MAAHNFIFIILQRTLIWLFQRLLVLAASSPKLRSILLSIPYLQPLIYLSGVKFSGAVASFSWSGWFYACAASPQPAYTSRPILPTQVSWVEPPSQPVLPSFSTWHDVTTTFAGMEGWLRITWETKGSVPRHSIIYKRNVLCSILCACCELALCVRLLWHVMCKFAQF